MSQPNIVRMNAYIMRSNNTGQCASILVRCGNFGLPEASHSLTSYQVLKESKFKEHGRITPGGTSYNMTNGRRIHLVVLLEEFVAAGDFLTYKFPVWSW